MDRISKVHTVHHEVGWVIVVKQSSFPSTAIIDLSGRLFPSKEEAERAVIQWVLETGLDVFFDVESFPR